MLENLRTINRSTTAYNAGSFTFVSATYETSEDEDVFTTEGTLTEPRDFVEVVVTRTDATHGAYGAARVNYSVTWNGSTTSGDATYNNPSGGFEGGTAYLEFANGEISQTFRVYGFLDSDFDPGDSITIALSDPDLLNGAVVGALASTTITILNTNPAPGTVQFSAASYTVDENKQSVTVTVTRTDASETDMQVSYAVIGGTATGGSAGPADYGNGTTSGTLFFSHSVNGAGEVVSYETSKTFTIPIFDDPDIEGDETILLQLSNPTNGGLLGTIATTTVTIHDIQPVPQTIVPKFNGKIAFVRSLNIGGNSPDLIVMNPNGSAVTNITNSADVQEMSPAWSPDGSKLAYVAFGVVGTEDITGINVINVNGTGRVQLTQSSSDTEPTWSPDGTCIAFVRFDNGKKLMVMNADGSNVELILADIYIGQPRWSPNGTHIAYEGRSALTDADAIFEIGTDGFGKHMLFPSVSSTINSATNGSYTPDGTQMIFRGVDLSREGRTDGIYRANVDGTGTPERLADGEFQLFLSPEGNRLAFGSTAGSFPRIVLSNLDGTQAVNVTDGSGGDREPVWQPLLTALPPDTQAPTVLSVTPNTITISDDYIGTAEFSLTVVFSEGMDTSVTPTLSFPVENPNSTLTFNAGESGWLYGSTTYVAKYNVVDANKTLPNVDVRVSGGQDLAGNSHVATTFTNKFSLDMAGTVADMTLPYVTAFERFNPLAIQTTASTLVFRATFSESVDVSTVDATDFSVNGSTATITSVTPVVGTLGLSFDVTVSGGNLPSYLGTVGLDVRLTSDILDTVGLPLTHFGPLVDEVYQHSPSAPNRVPSFTKGANQTVLEDSGLKSVTTWATAISPGTGASDVGQTLDFIVTNNNNALFNVQPTIAANGTLTFTPAANANGAATVTVRIHDNGGIAIGGIDTSAAQTFTITVTAVNDVPSFTKGPNQTVNEDAVGVQTVTGWATDFSRGATNESAQTLSFLVTNDNAALFKTAPAISATGVLTYTLNPNANGVANVSVKIKDDGGVANGGVDTSAAQVFAINVTPVNDAPSFKKGADQSTNEDTAVSVANWATLISAGAPNESGQTLDFQMTNDNNGLFLVQPAIGANGTLTYTPALNASGAANITVKLHDNGGGTAPNVDLSAAQTFKITIKPVNDLPTATVLLPQTIAEDTSTGPLAITIGDVETSPVNLTLAALSSTNTKLIPLTGITFGGSGTNRTVTVTPAANQFGSASIAFTVKDANGGVFTENVLITVTPVNDALPTISNIVDLSTAEDTPTAAIKFTVDDVDDKLVDLNAIIVTATSSNTGLVPNLPANIVLGGSLGARTIQLSPALDQSGTTTITVKATDSSGAFTTDTFLLTVTAVNDAPRVTAATLSISEFTTNDTPVGTVTAADPEGVAITAYSIFTGNTNNAFKIDNSGVIRVNDATKIDFEALAKYTLTIKATDAGGGFSS
ncbi:MAG: tandem-95 repeat protein, partial [Planctomycetia bacterium]|nr:tandem-95 repeat protein [Planctomycetia bacterium]